MAITKQPYELSVWSEKLNDDGIKEEIFGAVIGGHDMTFLGRATQVKLKRELKGTNTLTFQMPSKYFDSQVGDYVHNELVDLIHNETKIKLKFGEDWYEFYVKKITENKKFKALMISYSCEDAFIDELSRTGYEIEFASDLNNSVAETGDFMEDILDMSIWDYTPEHNVGDFTEFNENRFYKIPLKQFGGSIAGYKIKLEVKLSMMFDADGNPNDYLLRYLHELHDEENFDEICKMMEYTYDDDDIGTSTMTFDTMTDEQYSFIEKLLTIYNIFTDDERMIEFGDDLARERELFWDPYYKDNGIDLLSDENKYTLTGDYIYVPITDLSMIMGSIYEDAYTAVEEPARYGSYGDEDLGYALQPSSENPRAFVQFVFLDDGDVFNIDEEDVLCDNDFHYVIPIEEWNELLKAKLGSEECVIYWKQVVPTTSTSVTLTTKYSYDGPDDDGYMWTTDAMPSSSTIDDFTWYPVYYEGYLTQISDTDVTQARKISVTDRTEYNAEADMFVTVYNNKSNEYVTDQVITEYIDGEEITHNLTLYTDNKLEKRVLMNYNGETDEYGDTEFRVCSKLNTRQILPTLAANLVENGSSITDTNGWETRIQNKNNEKVTGTSSYSTLLTLTAQSTVVQNATSLTNSTSVTIEDYDIEGTDEDLSVSDYYLELLSPCVNNMLDFSKEGQTEIDYALNFGIVSQEKQIEKDKVYAIRMITGNMITTGAAFKYRGISDEEAELDNDLYSVTKIFTDEADDVEENTTLYEYIYGVGSEALNEYITQYKQLFWDYKTLFDCFAEEDRENAGTALSELGINLSTEEDDYNELNLFYTIIDRWPENSDVVQSDKIALLDALLTAILFGAEKGEVKMWNDTNTTSDGEDVVSIDSAWSKIELDGLINLYDEGKEKQWQKLSSLAIEESSETNSYSGESQTNYKSSDIQYLKFYLYWHIVESQQTTISTYSASYSTQLTKSTIETWISEYLLQDKEFEKKINVDLDKVLIGEGAVDLLGNYQVQGTVFTDGSVTTGNEYISFDTIFTSDEDGYGCIDFIPDNGGNIVSAKSTSSILIDPQLHYYSTLENTTRKTWDWKLGNTDSFDSTGDVGAIADYPLLLFKANQTLENPYVAVKVESAPLEICFDSIVENKYGYDDINGVQFNVTDGTYYYEGADIKLVQVNSSNVSDAFRTAIGFDDSTGDFDVETAAKLLYRGESSSSSDSDSTTSSIGRNQIMTADDEDNENEEETSSGDMFSSDSDDYLLQSSRNAWTDTIDVESPAYCSSFLKNSDEDKSYPYLLFISNKFRGIVYLEAKVTSNSASDSEDGDDDEESGGED